MGKKETKQSKEKKRDKRQNKKENKDQNGKKQKPIPCSWSDCPFLTSFSTLKSVVLSINSSPHTPNGFSQMISAYLFL